MLSFLNDQAWRWTITVFLVARITVSIWAIVVVQLNPFLVSNLNLFGSPVVAAFDLRTGERLVYSRIVGDQELHFAARDPNLADAETASVWDRSGKAVEGTLVGARLQPSNYAAEDVFPYAGVRESRDPVLAPWQRFDANWYLKIAEQGYSASDGSTVYLPLYPLAIRLVGNLLWGNNLLAAILVSNVALIGAIYVLYLISAGIYGDASGRRTIALLLVFPTAFFFFAAYTEALFLLLALLSLQAGTHEQWDWAGLWGALAALDRLQGVLLLVPLSYLWWRTRGQKGNDWRGISLLLIPAATLAFAGWQYSFSNNASLIGAYEGQLHARFVMPWDNVAAALNLIVLGQASLIDWLNLGITGLFGMLIMLAWRAPKMPREFVLYAVVMYLAPMFRMTTLQPLVSMVRYVLILFPIWMLWGEWSANPWVQRALVYLSAPLALYLSAQFIMWGWVG